MKRRVSARTFVRVGASIAALFAVFVTVQAVTPEAHTEPGSEGAARLVVAGNTVHAAAFDEGEKLYMTRCMSCHQMNGQGVTGTFPPIDGSEWVTGDAGRLVRIILQGMTGPVQVSGVKYSGAMPPWGSFLNDEQVASLSTYVRTSWSNDASVVTADQVAKVRAATKDRKKPWTAEELLTDAHSGIPGAAKPAADKKPAGAKKDTKN